MTYYLILWMFVCPNFYNFLEKYHPPTFEEQRSDAVYSDWEKARNLMECPDGLAVWAKAMKVTKVEEISTWKPDKNDNLIYVEKKEKRTVVYEREVK